MNAGQWETSSDPFDMVGGLLGDCSVRQGGLWSVACFRRIWNRIPSGCRELIELKEMSLERTDYLVGQVERVIWDELVSRAIVSDMGLGRVISVVQRLYYSGLHASLAGDIADLTAEHETGHLSSSDDWPADYRIVWRREQATHADLLREVRGNPYRPLSFSPSWLSSDVLLLAQNMYDTREFSAAPILADALQDAGCDAVDLLNHLRDPNATHVRGCWALDLVLGKS